MNADFRGQGRWRIEIDGRIIEFHLDHRGLNVEEVESGRPGVKHRDGFVSYHELLAKQERQLSLL